jgi:hypothetical protein
MERHRPRTSFSGLNKGTQNLAMETSPYWRMLEHCNVTRLIEGIDLE